MDNTLKTFRRDTFGNDTAIGELPPFLRVLLFTDGTVTQSLQAYFWESVQVITERQAPTPAPQPLLSLGRGEGEVLLFREVRLEGADSERVFVRAQSWICDDELPDDLREALLSQRMGVGELLRESGLETYREVLAMGQDDTSSVWRRYRILMANRPFIEITERFPKALYE